MSHAERDAFDTLFDHAPDKLNLVKKVDAVGRTLGVLSPPAPALGPGRCDPPVLRRHRLFLGRAGTEQLAVSLTLPVSHPERDAFDTLFDHAPDKLNLVKKSLITFVNKHLNKLNLEVTELETQFADGVYLVLLMGLLEDYFVPLHNFYLTPDSFDQKVHNVSFAFELMLDGGLQKPKARPEDVVSLDLKSTLRVLYNLFNKYKNAE
ncbi:Beta-parvin [Myotis brandtii]|uniref:Beta-parvin n=1 Tax=Myotis brandtii TaxID=109478 RepID=S7MJD5_MYOBR|nr:Beta-parvin [Myotis brandtii]